MSVVISAAPAFLPAAIAELQTAFPTAVVSPLGYDTAIIERAGIEATEVATRARRDPLPFIRHVATADLRMPSDAVAKDLALVARAAVRIAARAAGPRPLGLQVWSSGPTAVPSLGALWQAAAQALTSAGHAVRHANCEETISVCVARNTTTVGLTPSAAALADWPGGRIRLAAHPQAISRAELKLEEAIALFDLALPTVGPVVDLGSAPGGWTALLRRDGLEVIAVDPGRLASELTADPGVTHVRQTAGRFLASWSGTATLIVNDMRMPPERSAATMVVAAPHLAPGGLGILTLKLGIRSASESVRRALAILAEEYEILAARQLFHNRSEVTVALRRATSTG